MMGEGGFMYGGGFMWIFWLLLIVVVLAVVKAMTSGERTTKNDNALEILKQRFARGEIDEDEFEKRRRLIQQ